MGVRVANCDNEDEKRYMFENVYRVCGKAGLYEDLYWLVQSAGWVTSVLEERAIFAFEQGVKDLTDGVRGSGEGCSGGEGWLDEDGRFGLRMIAKAVRLSVSYLDGDVRNVCFQLYGRLMCVCGKSCLVERFLKDVEKCAPKRWVRPIRGCLVGVDGATLEQIEVGFVVDKVKFTSDGIVGCGRELGTLEERVFKQNRSKGVTVMKLTIDNVSDGTLTRESESSSRAMTGEMRREEEMRSGHNGKERMMRGLLQELRAAVSCFGQCCQRDEGQEDEEQHDGYEQDEDDDEPHVSCSDAYEDLVAAGFSDGSIQIRRLNTRKVECTIKEHTKGTSCICLSADGKLVVSGSHDKTVRVWDVSSGAPVCDALEGHTEWVSSVAISGDGERVVSGSGDETVRVWGISTGAPACDALEGHTNYVTSVGISGDGERVVSGSGDETVRIWDVSTGAPVCDALEGHTQSVYSVGISGDGERVVSGSLDETVRVWEVSTGAPVCDALEGHTNYVTSVGISGDGERVVSGSHDWTVRVWDVSTGASVCNALEGHTGWVESVAVSGDGELAVSGSLDETVRVWDVATGDCLLVTEREKWDETVARYCGEATVSEEEERYYSDGNSLVRRSGNGSEEILAQFDSQICDMTVDSRRGNVVAGLNSGAVAILKIVK